MAQLRFPQDARRPASLHEVTQPANRAAEHLGDVPVAPPEPVSLMWSLETYPYADPKRVAEAEASPVADPGPRRRRRRRPGQVPA